MYNLEDLDAMTDDALATIVAMLPEEARKLQQLAGKADLILCQRLAERNATKLETENWAGTLRSSGQTHTIDDPAALYSELADIAECPNLDEVYRAPEPVKRWDQRGLNELIKRGGRIREVIERHRKSTPNPARLELTAKDAEAIHVQ